MLLPSGLINRAKNTVQGCLNNIRTEPHATETIPIDAQLYIAYRLSICTLAQRVLVVFYENNVFASKFLDRIDKRSYHAVARTDECVRGGTLLQLCLQLVYPVLPADLVITQLPPAL